MALGGARPVVELAGVSSLWGAAQQLGQEAAGLGGEFSAPVVLRAPLHPGEEAPWALLLGLGVAVAVAREAGEAALLLHEALQMRRPALIIEASAAGAAAPPVAAGQPRQLREGGAAVVFASGEAVPAALEAASTLSAEGHEVSVVDLRWLSPVDSTRLAALAGDAGRVVLAGGAGAVEVSVVHAAFLRLESPPLRAPAQAAAIAAALRRSISY
jgi:pyruvate/2-oxoglutarate/acetoin dehydrogenase E1 component